MKEIQISDELYIKLRDLAARITLVEGKETTISDALRLIAVPLKAVGEPEEQLLKNLPIYQKILDENKELPKKPLKCYYQA